VEPILDCGVCRLRRWDERDAGGLVAIADDAEVARYLADGFPHPYTALDARFWIALTAGLERRDSQLAIEVDGELAGGVGVNFYSGERRLTGHIGYWLGRNFWGRGIATAACRAMADHALANFGLARLETTVYAPNVASARVLEKAGFVREGTLRDAIVKGDALFDAYLYAKVKT
jgi:RimJ/RimL family protein N-acetyltransferase